MKDAEKHLKLVANSLYENDNYKETNWEETEGQFGEENGKVVNKNLLLNSGDLFQFSIANQDSKQEFHYHEHRYEIFISDTKIGIAYLGQEKQVNQQDVENPKTQSLSKNFLNKTIKT